SDFVLLHESSEEVVHLPGAHAGMDAVDQRGLNGGQSGDDPRNLGRGLPRAQDDSLDVSVVAARSDPEVGVNALAWPWSATSWERVVLGRAWPRGDGDRRPEAVGACPQSGVEHVRSGRALGRAKTRRHAKGRDRMVGDRRRSAKGSELVPALYLPDT